MPYDQGFEDNFFEEEYEDEDYENDDAGQDVGRPGRYPRNFRNKDAEEDEDKKENGTNTIADRSQNSNTNKTDSL